MKYDAIVIGAGHNGLVTAAYLARAGRSVLVLERRELAGGCAVTEEVWPGYRVSTAAYLVSLLQDRIVQELELERFGYRVDAKDPAFFSPFPDGRYLFMWQDSKRTLEQIAKFSRRDAEAYPKYEAHLERLANLMEATLLSPPPREVPGLEKILEQSVADYLDEWFESPELKVTLATDGFIGANGGPRSPGTAYILLHHCMGGVAGRRGLWGFVRGGMGGVSEAIAASARSRGVEIRLNSEVDRVLIRDGEARGVVLKNGDEIDAQVVVSNLDPHATFFKLVDPRELPPEFAARVRAFRIEGTSLKMNLALSGLPDFRALPGTPGPQHKATIHICPSMEYVESAWRDCSEGRPSRSPLIEMTIPTMYDATLAPEGRHIMGVFLQYAPYTLREGNWDEWREPFADRVLDLIEAYAPNFRSLVIDRQILTPLDLERRFGITGGNIFHGELRRDQMFDKRMPCRTPVPGLFLCGSGTHPGGGVTGAPGHNAARAILG
ncbi:MAG: NAD(P)/FAD-dependent oxidoreductase [Acidobacteriota bacterium]|nr:NAD(P)/FAD-dependent oxidoreductase [Acidobacteriota bacterium]